MERVQHPYRSRTYRFTRISRLTHRMGAGVETMLTMRGDGAACHAIAVLINPVLQFF
jgi:hypothetical protein